MNKHAAQQMQPMTMVQFKKDLRMILKTRGALRHQPLVRSMFWRELEMIRGRNFMRPM